MRILLMDLDTSGRRRPFPNLALMKLSAYHKAKGDQVIFNSPIEGYDKVYAACVFTWHRERINTVPPGSHISGYGIKSPEQLPNEIEHIMPDYDLYPGVDFSMGFTSRGCNRRCPWCVVPDKEGAVVPWASVYEFWDRRHANIRLMDNNLLAAPNWRDTLQELSEVEAVVDFNQGLDIRLVNDEVVSYLRHIQRVQLRFAFDDMSYEKAVREGITCLTKAGYPSRRLSFYVLVGYGNDETAIERMKILASLNVDVYPMLYRDEDGKEPTRKLLYDGDVFWHGNRGNINKFLRVVGRLPA